MTPCPRRQRGAALIALLAVIAMGASWFIVSRLNAESGVMAALRQNRNAEVLNRAKQALIGYVAAQAAKLGENRPGALPCPEAPGNFNDPAYEGTVAYPCTPPTVGRFPWRTLGLDKLVDASGEPLWYVVSPGWAGANTVINSNSQGQLTVDGAANDAIALIIAPGPAFSVPAAPGCSAWAQVRPTTGIPDWRNYLECDNATSPADASFVTTGPRAAFNDQVIRITVADLMPALEAAISERITREILPVLPAVYAAPGWGFGGSVHKYPYAATFANPATSAMKGSLAITQGLLPMTNAETFPASGVPCSSGPRCDPAFVSWASANMAGSPSTYGESCSTTATQVTCTFYYRCFLFACGAGAVPFTINATANNVGMAMRQLNPSVSVPGLVGTPSVSAVLNADGSATMAYNGSASESGGGAWLSNLLCGLGWPLTLIMGCKQSSVTIPIYVFADHPLLDTRTSGAGTSWFARNNWHEVAFFAFAPGYAASGAGSCTTGSSCLSVANVTPAGAQRAILILAGRSINGSARPSATPGDYLEFGNATGSFERQTVSRTVDAALKRPFNDRVLVVESN
jgi:hypothetical protein